MQKFGIPVINFKQDNGSTRAPTLTAEVKRAYHSLLRVEKYLYLKSAYDD